MNPEFKKALEEGIIEPAMIGENHLEVDGVKFYQFADGGTKMTAARFYAMADIQRDHDELKLDGATLDTGMNVIDEALTKALSMAQDKGMQEVLITAKIHVNNIKQRRKYNNDTERAYDIATAWHFAEDENPLLYDATKAGRNKKLWMKHPYALDFFLGTPIGRQVNWLPLFDGDALNFLRKQLMLELSILETTLQDTAQIGLTTATNSTLRSRMETLNILIGSLTTRLRATSRSLAPTSQNSGNRKNEQKKKVSSRKRKK